MHPKLIGTGHYLPELCVTNEDLASRVDTSDEWIRQRVGIVSRRVASQTETGLDMAVKAAQKALEMADISARDLDLILVATSTGDCLMPSMASEVQHAIGAGSCPALDIAAACSGFIYGINILEQYFRAGAVKNALLIGCERMSRVIDWTDRSTCVLFGDGAGAAVFTASKTPGLLASCIHSDGQHRELLYVENAIAEEPFGTRAVTPYLRMEGNKVFKFAVNIMSDVAEEVLKKADLDKSDIQWLVPHQANERIIMATAKKLGLSMDKVIMTLGEHGNTSAASIPLALDVGIRDGRIQKGDVILLEAFGAGFVWGAALLKY
ncbi:MAG: ketoacyl-ACP synthase III [Gammaproteobacteria bacterium]|nr:ketoacyl-ACP synthase III [Gammaproteobacteria bacterium]